MILRLVALWFLALAATAGCARKNDSVTGPPPALPPEISAVSPPDRSLRLVGEPSIWVRFALPMDSTSLNARTVFLLHDTNRIPMHLAWAPDSLTLHLQPLAALRLGWTYTIQLRPGVRSASGATFERPFESQFSMLSVRVPADPFPGTGASDESPHAPLAWLGTERSAGPTRYLVYAGDDSGTVALRAQPPIVTSFTPYLFAPAPWGLGRRVYWSIRVVNDSTQESADGPVWRFDTLAPGTPIDSFEVQPEQFGYVRDERVFCNYGGIDVGPLTNAAVQWKFRQVGSPLRLAGARLEFTTFPENPPGVGVHTIVTPWEACTMRYPGPPYTDDVNGRLAGSRVIGPGRIRVESSAFTAHVEAMIRGLPVDGYILRSSAQVSLGVTGRDGALMRVYFYRVTTPAPRYAAH